MATLTHLERLEAELQKSLLPRDPNDERSIFLEVRAGTSIDELGKMLPYPGKPGMPAPTP